MTETVAPIEIPDRPLFKAAEVCDLAKVQPYVLRSWEAEFKDLGVARSGSNARVYRREDVEKVLRIRHLLLIEGLTLAGVRRRIEEEAEPPLDEPAVGPLAPVAAAARERIGGVKRGLRSLLELLDGPVGESVPGARREAAGPPAEFSLRPPARGSESVAAKSARRSGGADGPVKSSSPRRKRSA